MQSIVSHVADGSLLNRGVQDPAGSSATAGETRRDWSELYGSSHVRPLSSSLELGRTAVENVAASAVERASTGGSLHDFGINIATSLCRDIALVKMRVDWQEVACRVKYDDAHGNSGCRGHSDSMQSNLDVPKANRQIAEQYRRWLIQLYQEKLPSAFLNIFAGGVWCGQPKV